MSKSGCSCHQRYLYPQQCDYKCAGRLLYGNGPPLNCIGKDGDFYIDIINNLFYGPKQDCRWDSIPLSLRGPRGLNGESGPVRENGSCAGEDGIQMLSGSEPPTNQGQDGDFYIQFTEDVEGNSQTLLFGPKEAGIWPKSVSLTGPR